MQDRTGIIHMNGRIYDPRTERFLQPDPLVQAPSFTQSFNRYAYVFNSPLSCTDPTGYAANEDDDLIVEIPVRNPRAALPFNTWEYFGSPGGWVRADPNDETTYALWEMNNERVQVIPASRNSNVDTEQAEESVEEKIDELFRERRTIRETIFQKVEIRGLSDDGGLIYFTEGDVRVNESGRVHRCCVVTGTKSEGIGIFTRPGTPRDVDLNVLTTSKSTLPVEVIENIFENRTEIKGVVACKNVSRGQLKSGQKISVLQTGLDYWIRGAAI